MSKTLVSAPVPVTAQPLANSLGSMDLYKDYHVPFASDIDNEKRQQSHQHEDGDECDSHSHGHSHGHGGCHSTRTRKFLLPLFLAVLALGAFMAVACWGGSELFAGLGLDGWDLGMGLAKRATGNGNGTEESPFVKNKRSS